MMTPADALQLVASFFDKEWPETNGKDVTVRKVTGGFCNRLHAVSRSTPAEKEPATVLLRHFGTGEEDGSPAESCLSLTESEQALIYWEMGRRGWGPRVYGLFRGGRVEEFVDSHTLTPAEAADPAIRRDVARSFARLHSLTMPFRRRNIDAATRELNDGINQVKEDLRQNKKPITSDEGTAFAAVVMDMDWTKELDWLMSLFVEHGCRRTLCLGDMNYMNILVRNHLSGDEDECRAILIDYETVNYGFRGIDIGGHFSERMYCWSHPTNQLTGFPAADLSEKRAFCESYLQEMRALGQELTEQDTVDHLLLEAEIGQMYQLLWSVLMCGEIPEEAPLLIGLKHMLDFYRQLKQEFSARK